jgi:hypothetical protein
LGIVFSQARSSLHLMEYFEAPFVLHHRQIFLAEQYRRPSEGALGNGLDGPGDEVEVPEAPFGRQ